MDLHIHGARPLVALIIVVHSLQIGLSMHSPSQDDRKMMQAFAQARADHPQTRQASAKQVTGAAEAEEAPAAEKEMAALLSSSVAAEMVAQAEKGVTAKGPVDVDGGVDVTADTTRADKLLNEILLTMGVDQLREETYTTLLGKIEHFSCQEATGKACGKHASKADNKEEDQHGSNADDEEKGRHGSHEDGEEKGGHGSHADDEEKGRHGSTEDDEEKGEHGSTEDDKEKGENHEEGEEGQPKEEGKEKEEEEDEPKETEADRKMLLNMLIGFAVTGVVLALFGPKGGLE